MNDPHPSRAQSAPGTHSQSRTHSGPRTHLPQREFALEPADNRRLASLCGPLESNLRLVESRLGVQIRRHGHSFRVRGEHAAGAENVLRDLFAQTGQHEVTSEQVHLTLVEHAGELPGDEEQSVVVLPSAERAERDGPGSAGGGGGGAYRGRETIRARGAHQRDYLANIHHHDLSFGIGPAGTGKTYLAVACAVEFLMAERVRRIVLVRPAVEAGERLGFLPGDMAQKVDPYLRPMYDALYEMMGYDRVSRFIERNAIEVAPLAFMRGRSLNESFIILDEAQNSSIEQMKMFLTRIGFDSRAVVTGDLTQTDLPPGRMSGLHHAQQILRGVSGVAFTVFDAADVVRHPLVQRIVQAYEVHERAARAEAPP
ncbi:MAG TPA: PhoH family protein [Steroidobacteraceae bacterium]|nr:PhoH family protein [Steroidobacteraceae bacterium]